MIAGLSYKEWIRIVGTVFCFSVLGMILSELSVSTISESESFPWGMFLFNFLSFLLTSVGFHLFAIRKNIKSFEWYVLAGALLGVLVAATLFFLNGSFKADSLSFIVSMSLLYGSFSGGLYSYSFWAFIVSKSQKQQIIVSMIWVFIFFGPRLIALSFFG